MKKAFVFFLMFALTIGVISSAGLSDSFGIPTYAVIIIAVAFAVLMGFVASKLLDIFLILLTSILGALVSVSGAYSLIESVAIDKVVEMLKNIAIPLPDELVPIFFGMVFLIVCGFAVQFRKYFILKKA